MSRRVLIVSSQVRNVHSGVGTYAAMVLRGLASLPEGVCNVTVATWTEECDPRRFPGFRFLDLGSRSEIDPTPGKFLSLGRRLVRELSRLGESFDTVHFLDAREGHAFVRSRVRGDAEVIGTVHDDYAAQVSWNPTHYIGKAADPIRRYLFHRWLRGVEARAYPRFDLLMVNSRATGETIRREYALDAGRMVPITLTVESEPETDSVVELAGSPRLLFCGGNFYRKGLDTCVAAMPEILSELPAARLHVAGDCASAERIRRLVRDQGVQEAVDFHGRVSPSRMAAMWKTCDVFLMPSRTEALGLVYLEAFRAGVPVIAGDRGGVTEIVHDRASGMLVTPGSPEALANQVLTLVGNAELREQVVAGGRRVLASRTPGRLIDETLAAYGLAAPPQIPEDQGLGIDAEVGVLAHLE